MRQFNLKVLLILSLGHMTTDIYQGALPAILPFLKERLSLSYTTAGIIMMASSFTSSIVQPLFGFFSDRKEKPALLPMGSLFAAVGFSLLAFAPNYAMVLFLVVVSGLGIASFHPEGFKTAYFFTGRRMATGMSIFTVGGNLGFALGPIIALSVITHLGFSYLPLILFPAVIFLSVLGLNWKFISIPKAREKSPQEKDSGGVKRLPAPLVILIGTVIMRSWIHAGLMTYIPFYYIDHLKGDPVFVGKLISAFLMGGVVGTIAGSPLADRWGHKNYLVISLLLTSVLLPVIFFVNGAALFATLAVLGMVLISTFTVTIVMAQQILPRNLGIASGLMVGFAIGTGGVGVTILGIVADNFGVPTAIKSIALLPVLGLLLSLSLRYPAAAGEKNGAAGK